MATVFRLITRFPDGAEIGYDYSDTTMKLLTLPYLRGTLSRTTVRYNIGVGEITTTLTSGTKTSIAIAQRPDITTTAGGKLSGPFTAIWAG